MKQILGLAAFLVLVPSLLLNVYLYRKSRHLESQNSVASVTDGDTFVLKSGQRIRLSNLEAPELGFCGSQEAKGLLEELILHKTVDLEIVSHDQFNRPLALVYSNSQLINEAILKKGWARYDGSPSSKREILKQAYDEAVQNKTGIFSSLCLLEKPENPDCLIKGNIDRHSDQKTYYFPGCSNYQQVLVEKDLGENWFCTEKEAEKAGFKKSPNCFGKSFP